MYREKEMNVHLIESRDGERARTAAKDRVPFGPGFPDAVTARTERLEVWGSSFNDPGHDFCLFRAFDAAGQMVAERRIAGY